jgi:hypothetical protein
MVRPNAGTAVGLARGARAHPALLAPTGTWSTRADPKSTGDPSSPNSEAASTFGGGPATTGATGLEAFPASPAPTPPNGAEPSAAGSPAPAVLSDVTRVQ